MCMKFLIVVLTCRIFIASLAYLQRMSFFFERLIYKYIRHIFTYFHLAIFYHVASSVSMRMPRKQTDFDSLKLQWQKVKSFKRSWLAGSPHVATHEEDMFEVSVHQYSWVESNPATPSSTLPPPAASCVQSCFKIYIIWVWSAFQMAFPVVTLSGNKGETNLLISPSLCVFVCVWQGQANRARQLKRKTQSRKETGKRVDKRTGGGKERKWEWNRENEARSSRVGFTLWLV